MKNLKSNVLIGIGLIINSLAIIVDHFFFRIPHIIYLPILIIGIICTLFGVIEYRKSQNKD